MGGVGCEKRAKEVKSEYGRDPCESKRNTTLWTEHGRDTNKDKGNNARGRSPSLLIQEKHQKEVEDPMINMRTSDFEKMLERMLNDRERKGKAPMASPPREVPKDKEPTVVAADKEPGDVEEVASHQAPRARQPEARLGELPRVANMNDLSEQIEQATRKLEHLKRRGAVTSALQKRGSPFFPEILAEVVTTSFKLPDLPKYYRNKDPQEHLTAFDHVIQLYGQSDAMNARIFITTLKGKAQEWFTGFPMGTIVSYEQLDFINRFNDEALEVQDMRIDMMMNIRVHGLKKGALASALAHNPPMDKEELMGMTQQYIQEEEMNELKDHEWSITGQEVRVRKDPRERPHFKSEKDHERGRDQDRQRPAQFSRYTPLNAPRVHALMSIEGKNMLK
ncbi:hypothetical protein DH2020_044133 [Rehmannia glutinosa]|uniref:Retrotransposon gag domain-containing protein n=1 Tax=Rehmannia glutinosa TaxID=99300 RepID=A0ABR0UHT3_REHGL